MASNFQSTDHEPSADLPFQINKQEQIMQKAFRNVRQIVDQSDNVDGRTIDEKEHIYAETRRDKSAPLRQGGMYQQAQVMLSPKVSANLPRPENPYANLNVAIVNQQQHVNTYQPSLYTETVTFPNESNRTEGQNASSRNETDFILSPRSHLSNVIQTVQPDF